jgi:hypothetical protein
VCGVKKKQQEGHRSQVNFHSGQDERDGAKIYMLEEFEFQELQCQAQEFESQEFESQEFQSDIYAGDDESDEAICYMLNGGPSSKTSLWAWAKRAAKQWLGFEAADGDKDFEGADGGG